LDKPLILNKPKLNQSPLKLSKCITQNEKLRFRNGYARSLGYITSKEAKLELFKKINEYQDSHLKELANLKKDKLHSFMMENFSSMYEDIENYTLFYKLNSSLDMSKRSIELKEESILLKNDGIVLPQMKWLPNINISDLALNEYLCKSKMAWPNKEFYFNEEAALQFLYLNGYNFEQSLEKIRLSDPSLKGLLNRLELVIDYCIVQKKRCL